MLFRSSKVSSVPDDTFENYLETHDANGLVVSLGDPTSMGDGVAGNDLVTTANISGVTSLTVSSLGIIDLMGIEDFTALQYLWCDGNGLSTLDVTQNTALLLLACGNANPLTSLDVTENILLTNLSINLNLAMTELDVTNNTALEFLNTQYVPLTSLEVTENIALQELNVLGSSLTSLDVTPPPALWTLNVIGNDIVSLDLSKNPALIVMALHTNLLEDLNVKNGNNSNVVNGAFTAFNNNLTCITVDVVTYSTNTWFNIDGGVSYSLDCSLGIDEFDSSNFTMFPNPAKDRVSISLNLDAAYNLRSRRGKEMQKGGLITGNNVLNISSLPNGLYFLNVNTAHGTTTKKIIKQ